MDWWTIFWGVVIVVALIVDTVYVWWRLQKLWKKSRYNPANRKKTIVDEYKETYWK
ncbi:MAG: hypothetical protein N3B18_02260 [Desulfobacterota bacterium]|nr:hypothetical protein [Thermodesulfobacteriota bacterium]